MNPRERVNAALNHKEPDLVPLDLGGNVSGIHIKAYKKLISAVEREKTRANKQKKAEVQLQKKRWEKQKPLIDKQLQNYPYSYD